MELYQAITIALAIGSPIAVALFGMWYNSRRSKELLDEMKTDTHDLDVRVKAVEITQAKFTAELDGVVAKISVQLEGLQSAITSLTQRINGSHRDD